MLRRADDGIQHNLETGSDDGLVAGIMDRSVGGFGDGLAGKLG